MDYRPLVEGCIANFGIFLDFLSLCVLDDFFRFRWKNPVFWVFLVHPTLVSVILSASVKRCFVSRMRLELIFEIGPSTTPNRRSCNNIFLSFFMVKIINHHFSHYSHSAQSKRSIEKTSYISMISQIFTDCTDFRITPVKSELNTVRLTLRFTGICSELNLG